MLIHFYTFWEKIKTSPVWHHKGLVSSIFAGLILNILLWVFLIWQMNGIVQELGRTATIPLHYNIYFGIDKFGLWWKVFFLPLFGSIIFLVNVIGALLIYNHKSLVSHFLIATATAIQLIIWLASIFIILINI